MVTVLERFFCFSKSAFVLPGLLLPGLLNCLSFPPKISDEVVPVTRNIIVYSNGGSVVSGVINSNTLGHKRLRLPPKATEISLSQDNENIKWFTIQMIPEAKNAVAQYQLVGVPSLKSGELRFSYSLPEISWHPQLNARMTDDSKVVLQLQAVINVDSDETFENTNVTLVLNNAVSVEKISVYKFDLNSFSLYPHRNIIYNLDKRTEGYSFLREWITYGQKDDVHALVQVKNPFSIDLNQTSFSVESNQINIESGVVGNQVRPGEILSLGAGIDDTISTFRSVKITEATDKRPLPFNHKISYEITNKSNQEKTLRLVSQRVMGTEHRSVYHFKQPPDATPENTLIWILTLKPGSTYTLGYDYDADVKDVPGENGFEAGG